jgi:hypothetical protein
VRGERERRGKERDEQAEHRDTLTDVSGERHPAKRQL